MLPPPIQVRNKDVHYEIVCPVRDIVILQDERERPELHLKQTFTKLSRPEAKVQVKSLAGFIVLRWHHRAHGFDGGSKVACCIRHANLQSYGANALYLSNWDGLWASKGTPRNVIAKLNAAVVDALADPAVRRRIADQGMGIAPPEQQTPEGLRAIHRAEIEKWWPIIKAAGIKGE